MIQEPNANAPTHDSVQADEQGLISTLLDFSFSSFITTKFIKFIYAILVFGAGLGVIAFIIGGFRAGLLQGLFHVLVSPIIGLLYLIFVRMWTELIVVAFRIAEHLRSIDAKTPPR